MFSLANNLILFVGVPYQPRANYARILEEVDENPEVLGNGPGSTTGAPISIDGASGK